MRCRLTFSLDGGHNKVIGVGVPGCVPQPANEFAKANEHYRLNTRYKAKTTEQQSLRRQH